MAWYNEFFSSEAWQRVQAARFPPEHSAAQAEQLIALLGLEPGDRVLDVPCGIGRISVPLAERGVSVTGVDITTASMQQAEHSAHSSGVTLELHRRDMRELPWTDAFDAVINMWGSFGYFDHAGNMAFLAAAARALKSGGALLIEGPCVEGILPTWSRRDWYTLGEDVTVLEDRSYDALSGVITSTWTILSGGLPPKERRVETVTYSIANLQRMLRSVGFRDVSVYRDLSGEGYRIGDRMHLLARL